MSSSTSEEKKNPVVTLKAQAEKFDFSKLRAGKDNAEANSGKQAYKDLNRMNFVINGKIINTDLIAKLYQEYNSLLPKNGDENEDYRPFAKEVFKRMFSDAGARVPNDSILKELITNCNQSGYEFIYVPFMVNLFAEQELFMNVNDGSIDRKVYIHCGSPNSVEVKCEAPTVPVSLSAEKICDLSFSLEFTLESQDEKNGVTYTNGNLSLTVPKRLKDYNIGDKSLFDIIKECFQKLCEKFGFFKIKIEHDLDKQLKVNSHLENMEPPIHSNEHGNTPGN